MQPTIYYTRVNSPWGSLFLAGTEASICTCEFMVGKNVSSLFTRLKQQYGDVPLQEDALPLALAVDRLKQYVAGESTPLSHPLNLRGTPFQLQVWSALQEIPLGRVATYGEIAAQIGSPRGARAEWVKPVDVIRLFSSSLATGWWQLRGDSGGSVAAWSSKGRCSSTKGSIWPNGRHWSWAKQRRCLPHA